MSKASKYRKWRSATLLLLFVITSFGPVISQSNQIKEPFSPSIADKAEDAPLEDEEGNGHSFLFKEAVFAGAFYFDGISGIPPGNTDKDHFKFSPRPPQNYLGLDYVKTFTSTSFLNKVLPDWLPVKAMDLHPRLVYDPLERSDGLHRLKFAPQDFWLRFNPGNVDRLMLRVGQFVIPYGVNPILAPRQKFILPIEATDLGLKWDWGIDLKGPIGEYDFELAASIGSGEGLHAPHIFRDSDRRSYLFTGRIGYPTYWDFQQGLSFLFGDLPVLRGPTVFSGVAISRWRIAYDVSYKKGTYLMSGAQVSFGQDGFFGDEQFVALTGGKTAEVLSFRAWADWVVPKFQNIRLAAQFESVFRDVGTSDLDDTALLLQFGYSFSTTITGKLHYRKEFGRSIGEKNDGLFISLIYYAQFENL